MSKYIKIRCKPNRHTRCRNMFFKDGFMTHRGMNNCINERLLFISGLKYRVYKLYTIIEMHNIVQFDKYMKVLSAYWDVHVSRLMYNREKVDEYFSNG